MDPCDPLSFGLGGGVNIRESLWRQVRKIEWERGRRWKDPTPEMLEDPMFNAIWNVIKKWDIGVIDEYDGYMGGTGNHARAIFDAVMKCQNYHDK